MKTIEEKLLPIAREWSGNIPVWAAKEVGIDASALRHWAKDNPDVTSPLRGVYTWYCDDDQIDWENCETARFLAKAGKGAYLWGPSVLELMEIGDVSQPRTYIAVPKRRRPQKPIRWVISSTPAEKRYKNFLAQSLEEAIVSSMPLLDLPKRESVISDLLNRFPKLTGFAKQLGREYGII